MSSEQGIVVAVLGLALVMFVWDRFRYDIVALLALLAMAVAGIVPGDRLFAGFGHPAVITVAAVLVISKGLVNAGVVDAIARLLGKVGSRPTLQVLTLTGVVAVCSGFINNVGALALLMPVAVWMSRQAGRSPSLLLMPLAFGSLLGGTMTLIGTPPNIIIASYRPGATPFGVFDFMPVGGVITLAGVAFIALLGWRLTPRRADGQSADPLFSVGDYLTELRVPAGSDFVGETLHQLLTRVRKDADVVVLGLVRQGKRYMAPSTYRVLQEDDILLVQADTDSLQVLLDKTGLELSGREEEQQAGADLDEDDVRLAEVVITSSSPLIGHSANRLRLRERHGLNVVAVARQGYRLKSRIGNLQFHAGDILLVQGSDDALAESLDVLGCLPLAERGLRLGSPRRTLLATGIFAASIVVIASGWLAAPTALVAGALVMVMAGLLSTAEAYRAIDWSIIVLLGAMIPVGQSLEMTGAAALIADSLMVVGEGLPPATVLALVMVLTMLLSNVVNNAAAVIVVAPIALSLAGGFGLAADAVLMAVAIGASCAFLTPIGHQSNALVMEPGGYRFGDYWRLGLPLSLLVVLIATPMIVLVWG
ncbi:MULTISPECIES: SLC13 family permease [Marinobacter]|uniref:SLC13 family permease n=1 Tax=Marinobacter profundi TaxID=2666256 RepID=A0A2G1UI64_9GAMM|nr:MULTISPECIES: SLC13 family permease [Marinobacter]MBD3658033.1 SLC13 family permease [Marinobacter sp.]PHQ14188.1 SLC13 family permease [Marinobacter profundi]